MHGRKICSRMSRWLSREFELRSSYDFPAALATVKIQSGRHAFKRTNRPSVGASVTFARFNYLENDWDVMLSSRVQVHISCTHFARSRCDALTLHSCHLLTLLDYQRISDVNTTISRCSRQS